MDSSNNFHYQKSPHLAQVTLLQAEMADFSYGKHAHEEYALGVTLAGRQNFFSGGAFHSSQPGNIMVFNPGQIHDGHSGDITPLQYRMLYIHPQQLEPMLNAAGIAGSTDFQVPDTLLMDKPLQECILRLAAMIDEAATDPLQQECELYQIATRIAQRCARRDNDLLRNKTDRLLLQARDFIQANLKEELSLDQISQAANLSKYHFLRLFRQQFGITPHQYLLNSRINRAREALADGAELADVVYDYGFTDLSHLNRRFKPVFGMTPKKYQQLVLNR